MASKLISIDLLILDFDGTLTDSIPPAVAAIQKMLRKLGLPFKTKEQINKYVGYGEIPLIEGSIGSKEPGLMKKAMRMYENFYMKEGIKKVVLYPHIREFLEYFNDKPKIIVSNKKDAFIKKILKNLKLLKYFKEIHGGDTLPCLKPDPYTINMMIKKYGIPKDRVLFIGDMTVDIETGKNAKVRTCAVTYGFDSVKKLRKRKPDILINDLMELKDLIE
jgi:phosphoglycolate phosphatase